MMPRPPNFVKRLANAARSGVVVDRCPRPLTVRRSPHHIKAPALAAPVRVLRLSHLARRPRRAPPAPPELAARLLCGPPPCASRPSAPAPQTNHHSPPPPHRHHHRPTRSRPRPAPPTPRAAARARAPPPRRRPHLFGQSPGRPCRLHNTCGARRPSPSGARRRRPSLALCAASAEC